MASNRHFSERLLLVLATLAFSAGMGGCTSGTGPEIANLVYIPLKTPVGEGKGTVFGTFNIITRNPDTVAVKTVVYDAEGKKTGESSIPLSDRSLQTSDTLAFGVEIDTTKKGQYTLHVLTVDGKGKESNTLTGTVAVTDLF